MAKNARPYERTRKTPEETEADIYGLLKKHGADRIMMQTIRGVEAHTMYGRDCDHFRVDFSFIPPKNDQPLWLRVVVPLGDTPAPAIRALLYYLKEKFTAGYYDILEFEQDWLPHIVHPETKKTIWELAKDTGLGRLLGVGSDTKMIEG